MKQRRRGIRLEKRRDSYKNLQAETCQQQVERLEILKRNKSRRNETETSQERAVVGGVQAKHFKTLTRRQLVGNNQSDSMTTIE